MPEPAQHCTCGKCIYWDRTNDHDGSCRRHAPMAARTSDEVAHWPQTRAEEGCGEGVSTGDGSRRPVVCTSCAYWEQFAGGLDPQRRRDESSSWWRNAGHCLRYAPGPSAEPGARAFWSATASSDSCADGRARGD